MTVDQLAKRVGVPKRFVTYATEIGLLLPAGRSKGGYRLYTEAHLEQIAFIRKMQSLGFYADQIKEFRILMSSDKSRDEKVAAFDTIYERHLEYLRDKAEHFQALYQRALDARETKKDEIVG